jgi:N-acetylglucosaminyldiphosphoundecaprenol N-acetyl-beta-D-mannosaminyltransferase
MPLKKAKNRQKILGVWIDSTSLEEVLKRLSARIKRRKKTVVFTPNPEFLVFAWENPWFRKVLNSADILLPDGVGLVLAGKIFGKPLKGRAAGADLVERLLRLADEKGWRVGIVGARRGVASQRREQLEILRQKYREAKIACLEETPNWEKEKWEIVFACQGMGEQERWIAENFKKTSGLVFMGAGGSLDYLTGFAPRAPFFIRKIGFEWLFRLLIQPWRWRRQLALWKFFWVVVKSFFLGKLKNFGFRGRLA